LIHGRFEGIRLISFNAGNFRRGAAVSIPGLGIISGDAGIKSPDLLRHEFGHVLQYRKWGFLFYWTKIAPESLMSAYRATRDKSWHHMDCWTEWSANRLSYQYFNSPHDWDKINYPLDPPSGSLTRLPDKVRQYLHPDFPQ
jgi:hypothetical protein